jgi:hypothetical protein
MMHTGDVIRIDSKRAYISRTTLSSVEQIKNHIYVACRAKLDTKEEANAQNPQKKFKKDKVDVSSMRPYDVWDSLFEYENCEIPPYEEVGQDVSSLALWTTSIYLKLMRICKSKSQEVIDNVLIMVSMKGVDVDQFSTCPDVQTGIRNFLSDTRRKVPYGQFMPSSNFNFPNIGKLQENFYASFQNKMRKKLIKISSSYMRLRERSACD